MEKENIELTFGDLNISKELNAVLAKNNFIKPTPIQSQVIPTALEGKDIVGIAQTGTGKTLAFGIPALERLLKSDGEGLILTPTRELAIQINDVLSRLGDSFRLKTALIIGGAPINAQIATLRRNPKIIIATPGRLADHLNQKTVSLKNINVLIFDEADRMFDVGFAPQIKQIVQQVPADRQTLLFSATMPQEIIELANKYMKTPLRIEISPSGTSSKFIEQELFIITKEAKIQLLDKLLDINKGSVLIFVRTRHGAKRLCKEVNGMGHKACELHSDRSLFQRKEALSGFKSGKYRVLIATDIAARGIDVKDISVVINYDLPDDVSDYVHRIGRTGRNGSFGRAISFVTKQETYDIKRIEKIIKKEIKISEVGVLPDRRKSSIPEQERFHFKSRQENITPTEKEFIEASKTEFGRENYHRRSNSNRTQNSRDRYQSRSSRGGEDRGKSKFHGKRGISNRSKKFR